MFDSYPTYFRYRNLALADPMLRGEDVYALQTALHGFGPGDPDGILGQTTAGAIRRAQKELGLYVDGLAGGLTQRALAMRDCLVVTHNFDLAEGLLRGQVEHESGFRVGNYSPLHGDSYDAGIAQRNTQFTAPKDAFTVPDSINALGRHISQYYGKFAGVEPRRRWGLAAGAWNAPAFACWLANKAGATVPRNECLEPKGAALTTFEQYIASVTTYLKL